MNLPSGQNRHLLVAEGYLELGLPVEANAEVEAIDPEKRDVSEVLALRLRIYSALQKWELLRTVARVLALRDSENVQWTVSWAYAVRRTDSIEAARLILLEAVERIPSAAIFHYNLACYECQVGEIEVAKARLQHAFRLEPRYRLTALEDEDLASLWKSMET